MAFSRFSPDATPAARIGLGLAAVGRPGYINLGRAADLPADRTVDALRERSHQLLDAAHAAGVRYLDTARSYGRAEEFLAEWLRGRPAVRDVVVGSKWGYTYTADWRSDADTHEVKDHSAATFDRQYAESTALLGDRLDLYQIHSVTPQSPALTDPAVLERLAGLRAAGVDVGLSTSGPAQAEAIRAALALRYEGGPLFRTVQSTFNVLEPSAGEALAEAHAAGLTVIVKEGMANGRLAGAAAPPVLREIAGRYGTGPDAVALAAVLHRPWAGIVLSGAATVAQLTGNLAAAGLRLDPRDLARLTELAVPAQRYWAERSALPWS
ncbi:aldo/keto reductase [Streptomyces carpaticus]|uniref:Aldo/keto reductase n=2 Tax=Streptomyces TaxID=1883 RepID=A0ABP5GL65_9ACTN|nr:MULTISPECIES: aldo/keto reductase [Streptomyces]QKV67811.1 aldo/keto reductase [Streptomyces harbinensis]UWM48100.1 aldo/keto reductase [Streptomyces carpaticus]